jgi:hypothetical protein
MSVDRRHTLHLIKELLKGGTPKWYSHPEDYKRLVQEWHKEAQENLLAECRDYKVDDQDSLADPAGRRVNIMPAAVFMRKLRNEGGLTCFSHDSTLKDGTASLFVLMPSARGGEWEPMCSIQVPLMWEWSLLRLDPATQLPTGFRDVGWRSAVRCLIFKGALSEEQAHEIFGKPRISTVSKRYRRMLWEHHNQRSRIKNAA